jgi:integrase
MVAVEGTSQAARLLLHRIAQRAKRSAPFSRAGRNGCRTKRVGRPYTLELLACDSVGMRSHNLRHTCGYWLAQAGVPEGHVVAVLGHSTVRMTERYAHLAPANSRAAVEKPVGIPKNIPSATQDETGEVVTA